MKVAHESPLFLMEESRSFNDYDYALVHLFDTYPEYYKFFVESLRQGREVILDNSVFELDRPFDAAEFAGWVKKLAKDGKIDDGKKQLTYIIPDILDDGEATVASAKEFTKKYKKLPGRAMSVMQGKTYMELFKCYHDLYPLVDKIGVSFNCMAFENYFETMQPEMPKLMQWVRGRELLMENLFHAGWLTLEKPLHLLGIALPFEYGYYTHDHPELDNFIETADTSNPILHGMLGISYEPPYGLMDKQSLKLAEMLNAKEEESHLHTIRQNIRMFRGINHLPAKYGSGGNSSSLDRILVPAAGRRA